MKQTVLGKIFLFGTGVTNATEQEVLEYILQGLRKQTDPYYIVTPNPEIVVYASNNPHFKAILNNARLALCDGMGVFLASKILGRPLKERIAGADLLEDLCQEAAKKPITVGFLGGGYSVAVKTGECLQRKYPGLKVVFAASEWPESWLWSPTPRSKSRSATANNTSKHYPSSLSERRPPALEGLSEAKGGSAFSSFASGWAPRQNIDILFVAFGFPKQEEWMARHIGKIRVRVMLGVGGTFEYVSGRVPRAPVWLRELGLEWLFRLIVQPWRMRRQAALLEFVWLVLREKLHFKGR